MNWTNKKIEAFASKNRDSCTANESKENKELIKSLSIIYHLQGKLKDIRSLCNMGHHSEGCPCEYCLIIKLIDGEL
jgi:hypothetical protein